MYTERSRILNRYVVVVTGGDLAAGSLFRYHNRGVRLKVLIGRREVRAFSCVEATLQFCTSLGTFIMLSCAFANNQFDPLITAATTNLRGKAAPNVKISRFFNGHKYSTRRLVHYILSLRYNFFCFPLISYLLTNTVRTFQNETRPRPYGSWCGLIFVVFFL